MFERNIRAEGLQMEKEVKNKYTGCLFHYVDKGSAKPLCQLLPYI